MSDFNLRLSKVNPIPKRNPIEETTAKIENFFNFLRRIENNKSLFNICKTLVNSFESELANDSNYYDNNSDKVMKREKFKNKILSKIPMDSEDLKSIINFEANSPLSIMAYFLKENIPDIIISNVLLKIQFSQDFEDILIPKDVKTVFDFYMQHFINNQKYLNSTKFDISNAIIDSAYGQYRFNMMHKSLTVHTSDLISIRKHIEGTSNIKNVQTINDSNSAAYEMSLGINKQTMDIIKNKAFGSFIIFGETSSGKTTLLRHLTNHRIEEKRNVCVIEDTPELFIKNSIISLVTNSMYTIHDLFVASLRFNPSYLIIGETRTEEIVDILESALTFKVASTIHAGSFSKAMERMYFMARPRNISKEDMHSLIAASVDMFIHMENKEIMDIWVKNDEHNGNIHDLYDCIFKKETKENFEDAENYENIIRNQMIVTNSEITEQIG